MQGVEFCISVVFQTPLHRRPLYDTGISKCLYRFWSTGVQFRVQGAAFEYHERIAGLRGFSISVGMRGVFWLCFVFLVELESRGVRSFDLQVKSGREQGGACSPASKEEPHLNKLKTLI